jgi:hypothetical protein
VLQIVCVSDIFVGERDHRVMHGLSEPRSGPERQAADRSSLRYTRCFAPRILASMETRAA